jgi:hypothetical protein
MFGARSIRSVCASLANIIDANEHAGAGVAVLVCLYLFARVSQ